jgi:hypothetical protein
MDIYNVMDLVSLTCETHIGLVICLVDYVMITSKHRPKERNKRIDMASMNHRENRLGLMPMRWRQLINT